MYTPWIPGRDPGKLSNLLTRPKSPLKISSLAKDKRKMLGVRGGQLWEAARKSTVNRVGLLCKFKTAPSPLIRVSTDLVIYLFLVRRGRHLHKWRFLFKCLLQKGNLLSFQSFSCVCCFLKIVNLK